MEKGGGKLMPIRTTEQQRRKSANTNGWLPAVDLVKRDSKYSAKDKVYRLGHCHEYCSERAVCKDQRAQLVVPRERGHSGYHSYSGSKHFPNYSFRNNSHIIHAVPAQLPIPSVSTKTRPKICMHCAHLLSNGARKLSSIHSTLAYAKCRCHRPDTTDKTSRQDHGESENTKLFKRVEFAHVANDNQQTMLPSLKKSVDHQSDRPPVESSFTEELMTSSSKLPTLKSGSVVSTDPSSQQQQIYSSSQHRMASSGLMRRSSKLLHNSTTKLSPITEANTSMMATKKKHNNFKLTDLWKYVSDEKRQNLIKLFKKLDVDDDGHISWKEFLSCLSEVDQALKHYLHELYKLTSEATYFGKQEFVVCYGVHELLHCKKLPSSLYLNVDRYFLNNFIMPFMMKISAMANSGQLNMQQLERNTLCTSSTSQVIFARAKQWTNSSEASLLQLLSYAPVILSPV